MFESKLYRFAICLILVCLVGVYGFWIVKACNGLLPVWSDEFSYYLNARSFTENTTLRAALTFTGKGAYLFQADAHGFAYPLLHGLIGKLVGFNDLNLPFTNLVFILLALLAIFYQKNLLLSQKMTIAILLMAYMLVPIYSFTYMQEILNFFIAVCCTLVLYKIYESKSVILIYQYIFLIAIAALFRPLWLFWSIGLLPLAKDKKQVCQFSIIFIFCSALAFIYMKIFFENFPSYFSGVIEIIGKGRILEAAQSLYSQFVLNIGAYFFGEFSKPYLYYSTKIVIFFSVVVMAALCYLRKEKIYFAVAFIGAVNFALLLITYEAWDWREIRSMSPLFFMFSIIIVLKKEKILTISCLIFVVLSFPAVFTSTEKIIFEHQQQSVAFKYKAPYWTPPKQMMTLLDNKPNPLILFGYLPRDYRLDLLLLPLRTPSGKPVRYAINYYGDDLEHQSYDYLLYHSAQATQENIQPILKMSYFNLYPSGTDSQPVSK